MLRNLWLISLMVRATSLELAWKKAPAYWKTWAAFYLFSGLFLRAVDYWKWGGHLYLASWQLQQIGSAALMVYVIRAAVKPTLYLVTICAAIAASVCLVMGQTHHFPRSFEEPVMWICGGIALAQFLISLFGPATVYRQFLSGWLLMYSLLMLAGADYLTSPQLGVAWSLAEIVAFACWAVCFAVTSKAAP